MSEQMFNMSSPLWRTIEKLGEVGAVYQSLAAHSQSAILTEVKFANLTNFANVTLKNDEKFAILIVGKPESWKSLKMWLDSQLQHLQHLQHNRRQPLAENRILYGGKRGYAANFPLNFGDDNLYRRRRQRRNDKPENRFSFSSLSSNGSLHGENRCKSLENFYHIL